jgi:hypothetical protein
MENGFRLDKPFELQAGSAFESSASADKR